MKRYLVIYLGGNPPSSPEEGKAHFARYQQWLQGLGSALESPMNPIKSTHVISAEGEVSDSGSVGMSGFTIIRAESIEAATALCRDCPFLNVGGSLEVSELVEMS